MREKDLKKNSNMNIKEIYKMDDGMIDLIKEVIASIEKEPKDLDISNEMKLLDDILGKPTRGMERIRNIEAMALKSLKNG